MANNKTRKLCDWICPLSDKCRNFVIGFDKKKTLHWGGLRSPYDVDKGNCRGFAAFEPDDKEDEVQLSDDEVNRLIDDKLNGNAGNEN